MFYHMGDHYYGLMYVEPYPESADWPSVTTSGFYQVVETSTGMRTFWLTDRTFSTDPDSGEKIMDDYSDIIIYRDWPSTQQFHINIYQNRSGLGEYEKVEEYDLTSDIVKENNMEYNKKTALSFKNDEKSVVITMKSYNTASLERIETDHDDKIMSSLTEGTCTIPYGCFSNDVYTIDLYYGQARGSWSVNTYDMNNAYKLVNSVVMDPADVWNRAVDNSLTTQDFYYNGILVCHIEYSTVEVRSWGQEITATIKTYNVGAYDRDYDVGIYKMSDGTFRFNTVHISKCYI